MMDPKNVLAWIDAREETVKALGIVEDDQAKTALRAIREAVEKQIPRRPFFVSVMQYECPVCPECDRPLTMGSACACGQRINWSKCERGDEDANS